MKESDVSQMLIAVYPAMRSLFRLSEMATMGTPEVILDNERSILKKRVANLKADEILFMAVNYNNYAAEARTKTAIADQALAEDLSRFFKTAN